MGGAAVALVTVQGVSAQSGYAQSVTVGNGEVIVGESTSDLYPGSVYIYTEDGGEWAETQRLQASDASEGDHFGRALATDGSTLIVGATVHANTVGAAYVFERTDDGWTEVALLAPSDGTQGDAFGRVAAMDGDFALVSTWGHAESRGAVYVFHREADGTWSEYAKLMGSDVQPQEWFGMSLAISGDDIFVGTPQKNENRGSVYVFGHDTGAGTWTEQAVLTMDGAQRNTGFGSAVAVHGNRAMIGAVGVNQGRGVVYEYERGDDGAWTQTGSLTAFHGGNPNTQFGAAIVDDGDRVWITAPGAAGFAGTIYVFEADEDGNWVGASKVDGDETSSGDQFAATLAVRGDVAVAGALGEDFGAGTAVILESAGDTWAEAGKVWNEVEGLDPLLGGTIECADGKAAVFDCTDVDILSFLPVQDLGGSRGVQVNDVWGWVDPESGREYALVGRYDGTSFIDVTDASNPMYLGNLPMHDGANGNVWRDIKVYENHAYIVADGSGEHGMQVFDLTQLRDVANAPAEFSETAHYDRIASAHNIVINEDVGYAYAVGVNGGGDTCGGGLHMINIQDPTNPTFAGCFSDTATGNNRTGYSHDAQCVEYHGPDTEHAGKDICFGSNETALSVADVTDKANPVALSNASYPNVGYSHQGWLDEEQRYFYMNDELDEVSGAVVGTRTLVWDVQDLDDPILVKEHFSENRASDHNLYIVGDLMYQSNYTSGLRVLDISDRESPVEVAYFDTVPWGEDVPAMDGSWSNYPFFPSGTIVVTSGREGVFLLQKRERNLIP
jgi:choice-of-anchor B domain-containing protein